ncbi:ZrgA family zinc uptake protein [Woodsholea maritima]|uniref:ZrgA family zinc uptake protein n=1 Tax=Woodsholea maritima TaxID=240237 RepID=UPI00035D73CB|nr:DUF2796 domain-containing protein [Woodsholea maritima]
MSIAILSSLILTSAPALGTHVHGVAHLDMALNSNGALRVEFTSPKHDVLGFEHAPETPEEHEAIKDLETRLERPESLFSLTGGHCALTALHLDETPASLSASQVHSDGANPHDEHDHDDDHHDDHDHAHSSDLNIAYDFMCESPAQLGQIILNAFETFPSLTTIELAFLSDRVALTETVSRANTSVRLR